MSKDVRQVGAWPPQLQTRQLDHLAESTADAQTSWLRSHTASHAIASLVTRSSAKLRFTREPPTRARNAVCRAACGCTVMVALRCCSVGKEGPDQFSEDQYRTGECPTVGLVG
jgi:hypothetical protein